jgi:anti-sigma B factor antagonist
MKAGGRVEIPAPSLQEGFLMERLVIGSRAAMANTSVTVVDIEGVLDINTVSEFEAILQELFKKKQYKIVLNMKKLTYISSAGFGVLMSIIKDVRKNRGDIKIANITPEIFKVFDLLELPGLFHILKTEEDAVSEF